MRNFQRVSLLFLALVAFLKLHSSPATAAATGDQKCTPCEDSNPPPPPVPSPPPPASSSNCPPPPSPPSPPSSPNSPPPPSQPSSSPYSSPPPPSQPSSYQYSPPPPNGAGIGLNPPPYGMFPAPPPPNPILPYYPYYYHNPPPPSFCPKIRPAISVVWALIALILCSLT